ncbi:hypothetical protein [Anaerocellum danielii]|uniref:Uncharacterized protein n=1 Tax=Anaerocellum danielii TaxID=1387557 RepID=A0ABZ0U0M0_9FIRM|nr:hypothetical protein [Caldicellulosiruptor danielii]WPX09249.1 hypothetical protein SOJ16_000443 [Caldicellulosiruptor danielii]
MNKKLNYKLICLLIILSLILSAFCWNYFNTKKRFDNAKKAAKFSFPISQIYAYTSMYMEDIKKNNKLVFSDNFLSLYNSVVNCASILTILRNMDPEYRKYKSKVPSIWFTVNSLHGLLDDIYFNISEGKPIVIQLDANKFKTLTTEDIYNELSKYCNFIKNVIFENGNLISDKYNPLYNTDKYFDKILEKWDANKAESLFHKNIKNDITLWP